MTTRTSRNFRFQPADIHRRPEARGPRDRGQASRAGEEPGQSPALPPLALYRPSRNVRGMGAIVMLAGDAVSAFYDRLAALGLSPRKHEGRWVFICPAERFEHSPLLRAELRLLLAEAKGARGQRLDELELAVAEERGDQARAAELRARIEKRRQSQAV